MKNKLLIITLLFTANAGYCATRTVAVHDLMIKFVIAMVGVMLASIAIWAILAIYNKFFVNQNLTFSQEEEYTKPPKTIDEAIKFFINKNRLK